MSAEHCPRSCGMLSAIPAECCPPSAWNRVRDHAEYAAVFTPFLLELLAQGLSRKTRNLHRDNLWLLGGEIIRDLNDTPKLRKRPVADLIREVIANDEGPLIHGGFSEQEQRSFDSTCKKLNRFLAARADSQQK